MFFSITATGPSADGLGFLLHKHPDRVRTVSLSFGNAHVFYPESEPERVTAALLVEVDPVQLSRRRDKNDSAATLQPYVNDRPYVASSFLSVAISKLFGTALSGVCEHRPELVAQPLPLEITVPAATAKGGPGEPERFFGPLGWSVETAPVGDRHVAVKLTGEHTVQDALSHLFVLLPALDGTKHYWIGRDEVDKLLRRGGSWLPGHPEQELISRRFLRFREFTDEARERLSDLPGLDDDGNQTASDTVDDVAADRGEAAVEKPIRLQDQRMDAVMGEIRRAHAERIVDLGCGEGQLLKRLVAEPSLTRVVGVDVSTASLERAAKRLKLDDMPERRREQIELLQGALTYRDARLTGFDTAALVEVIEHVDPERLDALAQMVFGGVRPTTVIVTTPNREYNANFAGMAPGQFRHRDHRFEWDRAEFAEWTGRIVADWGYSVRHESIGPEDEHTGAPTQMAVFTR